MGSCPTRDIKGESPRTGASPLIPMQKESETGESDSDEQFPKDALRRRLDTVETGDSLHVTYLSRRSGGEITVSGEVNSVRDKNGTVWWADIATEDGRTIRVEDNGDVETVRGDGQAAILGPVMDFQREDVDEPEVMTDGGRYRRDPQSAWEHKMAMEALGDGADANPGSVVEVGSDRMVDLSDEPGHVQTIITDSCTDTWGNLRKRVRVSYIPYGLASNISEKVDGEHTPAGDMTPEDVPQSVGCTAVGFIESERGERVDDLTERVEQYISERWDGEWKQRERVDGKRVVPDGGHQVERFRYTFADELVEAIKSGDKTATVRLDDERQPDIGDIIKAEDTSGEMFATLNVRASLRVQASWAHKMVAVYDASHRATDMEHMISLLEQHYDTGVSESYPVHVVIFEVRGHV